MDLIFLFIAIVITIIGALPFGLVNLTVMDIAYQNGNHQAMRVAHGAAWIEVLFGVLAVGAGGFINEYSTDHYLFKHLFLIIPGIIGMVFLVKKKSTHAPASIGQHGFMKGLLSNLVSVQVLMYWLVAIAYLNSRLPFNFTLLNILLFTMGIWLGKMGVLWTYSYFSHKILSHSNFLAQNINRFIGVILILTVIIQILK